MSVQAGLETTTQENTVVVSLSVLPRCKLIKPVLFVLRSWYSPSVILKTYQY
jgi:hypothetical protein